MLSPRRRPEGGPACWRRCWSSQRPAIPACCRRLVVASPFPESPEHVSWPETETGAAFVAGVGYDVSINRTGSLAITPFFNWVVTTVGSTIDFLQLGLGLTFN